MSESRGLKEKAESFFNKFFDVHVSITIQSEPILTAVEETLVSSKANFRSPPTFRISGPAICDLQWTLGLWSNNTSFWSGQNGLHRRFQPSKRFDTDIELVFRLPNDASALSASTRTAVVNNADGLEP